MSTPEAPEPFDDLERLLSDESFLSGGPREASAEERIATSQRIARANDRLREQGEIADGTGKPAFRGKKRKITLLAVAAAVAIAIVVVALLARR